jgi:hypothetical protein
MSYTVIDEMSETWVRLDDSIGSTIVSRGDQGKVGVIEHGAASLAVERESRFLVEK